MPASRLYIAFRAGIVLSIMPAAFLCPAACSRRQAPPAAVAPAERPLASPYPERRTVLAIPLGNLSNNKDLDTLQTADIFYAELQRVKGLAVIPVNRYLAELADTGQMDVRSTREMVALADRVRADMVILFAVTEHRPYYPPRAAVGAQLYVLSRQVPLPGDRLADEPPGIEPVKVAEVTEVYDAADDSMLKKVREFAEEREGHESPYGWRIYLQDQRLYLGFAFNRVIRGLLRSEGGRLASGAFVGQEVRP